MGIPFYRQVDYLEDGVDVYQCLQCGAKIEVREYQFSPNFCCYCGVKYEGLRPSKQTDLISIPTTKELWFQIEEAYDWGDGQELNWKRNRRGTNDIHTAIKYLKDSREERAAENKRTKKGVWKHRIKTTKKDKYNGYVVIDMEKYYKKTGKQFNKKAMLCQ